MRGLLTSLRRRLQRWRAALAERRWRLAMASLVWLTLAGLLVGATALFLRLVGLSGWGWAWSFVPLVVGFASFVFACLVYVLGRRHDEW